MSFEYPLTAQSITLLNEGEPYFEPSASSAPADYDFLLGRHSVHHKKLKERLSNCKEWIDINCSKNTEPILTGIGNIEKHFLTYNNDVEAIALRLFNLSTKLWSLYWADNIAGTLDPPLQGSFEGNLGVFFRKDKLNGNDILVQFQYDKSDSENPVWGQAFSNDEGATWEWNWFMFLKTYNIPHFCVSKKLFNFYFTIENTLKNGIQLILFKPFQKAYPLN